MQGYRIEGGLNNTLESFSSIPGGIQHQVERLGLNEQVEQRPWLMLGAAVAAGYLLANLFGEDSHDDDRDTRSSNQSRYNNQPRYNSQPAPSPNFYTDHPSSAPSASAPSASAAGYGGPSNYGAPTASSSAPAPSSTATPASYSVSPSNAPSSASGAASSLSGAASSLSGTAGSLLSSVVGDTDTIKSQATDMVRNLLRDTIRENLPQLRDQVDDLDRRKPRNS